MAANKSSSSPILSSTKPNPAARYSETKDPIRRSFTGNPFSKPSSVITNSRSGFNPNTPANSPSDFARQSYEDKENMKDLNLKSARVRSPASASKGTKNFMAPTISAASKFTSSPRKKILVDRNEPGRSSLSSSESKSQVIESVDLKSGVASNPKKTVSFADAIIMLREEDNTLSKKEMDSKSNQMMKATEASHDSTISDMGHKETLESDSVFCSVVLSDTSKDAGSLPEETVSEGKYCVILDPTFNISGGITCSTTRSDVLVAPQHGESRKAYDPVTNFLVPRPQFRLYKPNPSVQHILNRRREGKPDYSSGSEVSSEEDSEKEPENVSSGKVTSKESQKEPENISLGEIEEKEEEELIVLSQPKGVSSKPKLFFTTLTMFMAFLWVVLAFTFLSISLTNPPVTDLPMLNDLSLSKLYVPPEITEFAKMKFEGLAQRFKLWSENTFVYIWKLISEFAEVHKLAPVQYSNLTALREEDHLVDGGYQMFGHSDDVGAEFWYKENVAAPIREREVETEQFQECRHQEVEAVKEDIEEAVEEDNSTGFEEQVHESVVEDHTEHLEEGHQEIYTNVAEEDNKPITEQRNINEVPESGVVTPNSSEAEQAQEIVSSDVHSDIKPLAEQAQEIVSSDVHSDIKPLAEQPMVISEPEQAQAIVSSDIHSDIKPVTEQPMVISEVTEMQPDEVFEIRESQVQSDVSFYAEIESTKAQDVFQNSELAASMDSPQNSATVDDAQNGSEDKFLTKNFVATSLLAVLLSSLLAVIAFTYAKRRKPSTPMNQPVLTKKFDYSPSEVSSFRSCSYDSKQGLKDSSEAQSEERKTRKNYKRESLASSDLSMSSASYGSFTTYEKLSSKHHRNVDEDTTLITPVRRSSRIRKQVTSP